MGAGPCRKSLITLGRGDSDSNLNSYTVTIIRFENFGCCIPNQSLIYCRPLSNTTSSLVGPHVTSNLLPSRDQWKSLI